MIYNPGQVEVLFKYLEKPPNWFILGGPADGDEAQCFHAQYPTTNIIGLEPCTEFCKYQLRNRFPGILINSGLSDTDGTLSMRHNGRMSSMVRDVQVGDIRQINVMTLDTLSSVYGPFTDAVLWLDIEGMEYQAMLGAVGLLASQSIELINLEFMEDVKTSNLLETLLEDNGFRFLETWKVGQTACRDRIYKRLPTRPKPPPSKWVKRR